MDSASDFRPLPLLFVDIEGFSKLPEATQAKVVGILRDALMTWCEDHQKGDLKRLVKLTGDGALVVGETSDISPPMHKLSAYLQDEMLRADCKLRQGLHYGRVCLIEGMAGAADVVGHAVNLCQRVMSVGDGGHILMSEGYVDNIVGRDNAHVHQIGEREVKHGEPLKVFNYFGEQDGVPFGNPTSPPRLPWTTPAGGIGVEVGCDDVEIFPNRNDPKFPYRIEEQLKDPETRVEYRVVSRTARSFRDALEDLEQELREGRLHLRAVVSDPVVDPRVLSSTERTEYMSDIDATLHAFSTLKSRLLEYDMAEAFSYLLSPTMILDSVSTQKTEGADGNVLRRIIFDIYSGTLYGKNRPCLVVTHARENAGTCLVELIEGRAGRAWSRSGVDADLRTIRERIAAVSDDIYERARNNPTTRLLPKLPDVFQYLDAVNPYLELEQEPKPNLADMVPMPVSLQVEVTDTCNVVRCAGCSRGQAKGGEMPLERIRDIASDLRRMRTRSVVLSGGEPLLHSHIADVLRTFHDNEISVHLLTDGLCLKDKDIREAVCRYVSSVRVSLGGATPELYRAVHYLKKTIAIPDPVSHLEVGLAALKEEAQGDDCALERIAICTTLYRQNYRHVDEIAEWVDRQDAVDSLVLKFAHGTVQDVGGGSEFVCTQEEVEAVRKAVEALPATLTHGCTVNRDYLLSFINKLGSEAIAKGKPLGSFYDEHDLVCFTPCLTGIVDAKGHLATCCHLYYDNSKGHRSRSKHLHGTLNEGHSLQQVWRQQHFERLRQVNQVQRSEGGLEADEEKLVCRCPMRSECTRHWNHNLELTQLYRAYVSWSLTSRQRFSQELESIRTDTDEPFWL